MNSQENLVLHHLSRRRMDGESGRDRDALIAYHHEVANEAGYTQLARKALKIFGVLGGGRPQDRWQVWQLRAQLEHPWEQL